MKSQTRGGSPKSPKRGTKRTHDQRQLSSSPTRSGSPGPSSKRTRLPTESQKWRRLAASITGQAAVYAVLNVGSPPASGTEPTPHSTMINFTDSSQQMASAVRTFQDQLAESVSSPIGRQTQIPPVSVPVHLQPSNVTRSAARSGSQIVVAASVDDVLKTTYNDLATEADIEKWKDDVVHVVSRLLRGKGVSYSAADGTTFVATPWISSLVTYPERLAIDPANCGRFLVTDATPSSSASSHPPTSPADALSSPAHSLTFPALALAASPRTPTASLAPCTHEPVVYDAALSGTRQQLDRRVCLECFSAVAERVAADATAALQDEQWEALHNAVDTQPDSDAANARAAALTHMRETADEYISDAWLHAVQHAGYTLGASRPSCPEFISRVVDMTMERVRELVDVEQSIEQTGVSIVEHALKDVARAMLLEHEAYHEGARRAVVDAAVDLAIDPKFAEKDQQEHGHAGSWEMFLRAFNEVWTASYLARERGFESLVSAEEWAEAAREEARDYGQEECVAAGQDMEATAGHSRDLGEEEAPAGTPKAEATTVEKEEDRPEEQGGDTGGNVEIPLGEEGREEREEEEKVEM